MRGRKIRLDRGDTLGGTVPLTLRDHVQPDVGFGERRFGRRRRRRAGLLSWLLTVLLALAVAGAIWVAVAVLDAGPPGAGAGEAAADGLWPAIQAWVDGLF